MFDASVVDHMVRELVDGLGDLAVHWTPGSIAFNHGQPAYDPYDDFRQFPIFVICGDSTCRVHLAESDGVLVVEKRFCNTPSGETRVELANPRAFERVIEVVRMWLANPWSHGFSEVCGDATG